MDDDGRDCPIKLVLSSECSLLQDVVVVALRGVSKVQVCDVETKTVVEW